MTVSPPPPDLDAPPLLVGEAVEDWTGDARFYEYTRAADPLGSGAISPIPVRRFPASVHQGGPTRVVPLDLSEELGVRTTATSPALLAAFVVLRAGEAVSTEPDATSELYYVLRGSGTSSVDTVGVRVGPGPRVLTWAAGDFFVLPALCTTVHRAAAAIGDAGDVLYRVTDAPLLHYLGARPSETRFRPTRYDGAEALARLAYVEAEDASSERNRVSILLGNAATPQTLTATHTLWAMLGVLPAGRVQRPHRHQSVALYLIVDCRPGCFSLVGPEIDGTGSIVDPERVDWESGGAFVTPPGLWHSHHNESGAPAHLVPVQDAGLHTYLRTLDIRFTRP